MTCTPWFSSMVASTTSSSTTGATSATVWCAASGPLVPVSSSVTVTVTGYESDGVAVGLSSTNRCPIGSGDVTPIPTPSCRVCTGVPSPQSMVSECVSLIPGSTSDRS